MWASQSNSVLVLAHPCRTQRVEWWPTPAAGGPGALRSCSSENQSRSELTMDGRRQYLRRTRSTSKLFFGQSVEEASLPWRQAPRLRQDREKTLALDRKSPPDSIATRRSDFPNFQEVHGPHRTAATHRKHNDSKNKRPNHIEL